MSEILGKCPHCGADYKVGQYGPYCTGKCGFSTNYAFGQKLTNDKIQQLLNNEEIFLSGLISKRTGKEYDVYLTPTGVEENEYKTKDGVTKTGYRYTFDVRFPEKKEDTKASDTLAGEKAVKEAVDASTEPEYDESVDFDDEELPFN